MASDSYFIRLKSRIHTANYNALNRAAESAVTEASKLIRERYNIKKSDLDKNFKIYRKASEGDLTVLVKVTKNNLSLFEFNAHQIGRGGRSKIYRRDTKAGGKKGSSRGSRTSQGVKAMVEKGKPTLYRSKDMTKGAFIATMKSGHRGVFIRSSMLSSSGSGMGFGGVFKIKDKEKIVELFGVSLTSLVNPKSGNNIIIEDMQSKFNDMFESRIKHELGRISQ